jgi:hypothetical protein
MKGYHISRKNTNIIQDDINDLDKLLTERIADFHGVRGQIQARHAYIFYRKLLWEIKQKFNDSLVLEEELAIPNKTS